MSKVSQIIDYQRKHPDASGRDIATALGVTRCYAAGILARARETGELPKVARGPRGATVRGRPRDEYVEALGDVVYVAPTAWRDTEAPPPPVADLHSADAIVADADLATQIRTLRDAALQQAQRYEAALHALGWPS